MHHNEDDAGDLDLDHDVPERKKPPLLNLNKPPDFITVEELADMLVLNVKTVYAAIQANEIPGVIRVRGRIRIHYPAVLEWIRTPSAGSRS